MNALQRFENFMKRFLGPAQLGDAREPRAPQAPPADAELGAHGFERRIGPGGPYIVRRG